MSWANKLKALCPQLDSEKDYFDANVEAIKTALLDPRVIAKGHGARVVFNIPNVHMLSFITASSPPDPSLKPYKNAYDLESEHLGRVSPKRRKVDELLLPLGKLCDGTEAGSSNIYFGAVELNGTGVRFYGDFCMVLKPDIGPGLTIVDRNSYDFDCPPLRARIKAKTATSADFKGLWESDLGTMAAIKVLGEHSPKDRRLTTGKISDAVLADEDYMEVLKLSSFSTSNLQEVRTNAADVALDTFLAERVAKGPTPSYEAMLWSQRRRQAEFGLKKVGIDVRVVTTAGRLNS